MSSQCKCTQLIPVLYIAFSTLKYLSFLLQLVVDISPMSTQCPQADRQWPVPVTARAVTRNRWGVCFLLVQMCHSARAAICGVHCTIVCHRRTWINHCICLNANNHSICNAAKLPKQSPDMSHVYFEKCRYNLSNRSNKSRSTLRTRFGVQSDQLSRENHRSIICPSSRSIFAYCYSNALGNSIWLCTLRLGRNVRLRSLLCNPCFLIQSYYPHWCVVCFVRPVLV